jgi:hypothetical protein
MAVADVRHSIDCVPAPAYARGVEGRARPLTVLTVAAVLAAAGCRDGDHDGGRARPHRQARERQAQPDHAADEHGHAPVVPDR